MEDLINVSNRLLNNINDRFYRSLLTKIDWSQRLIEIRGSRGVGKTTLMLQKAKAIKKEGKNIIYTSLDLPYFFNNSLFDFADEFTKFGGTHLFLDEVHRYPSKHKNSDWSLEIKNIYDAFPELKIVYSGSSILHLYNGKGDLSRRKASYLLNGLSFREYLEMNKIMSHSAIRLEELLTNHQSIAEGIVQQIKPLLHFKAYLKYGYYPFFNGNQEVYINQLQQVVSLIIDTDLPYISTISHNAKQQLKRLLGAISTAAPYTPNMNNLAELVQVTDHRTLLKYLNLLDEAQLISLLKTEGKGNKQLRKPDKIFLNNTNLVDAIGLSDADKGTERETFFFNQVGSVEHVFYSTKGDFKVGNDLIFEVGGKNKSFNQIKGIEKGYIASDGIDLGFGKKIPLWLFGFLY